MASPAETSPPRRGRCLLACCLVWALVAALPLLGWVFREELYADYLYPSLVEQARFDTRLTFAAAEAVDPARFAGLAASVAERLRRGGVLARVEQVEGGLRVSVLNEQAELARLLVLARPELRFQLVAALTGEERARELERLEALERAGRLDSAAEPYQRLPQPRPSGPPEFLLLEPPVLDRSHVRELSRALDSRGMACLAFELTPEGAERMRRLSEEHVGRQLAIVISGEVRSAPVLRGPIGKRGIVEAGGQGWDEHELTAIVALSQLEALPLELSLLEQVALDPPPEPR